MIYILQIRLRQNRIRKRKIKSFQNVAIHYRIAAFFISTRFCININNLPLFMDFIASAPDFKRVRFFNVKHRRYLSLFGGRSPPSALFMQKNRPEEKVMKVYTNNDVIVPNQQVRTSPDRLPKNRSSKNKIQNFTYKFAKIHFSNGIVSEREKEHRLAGTEGGELNGAIFFPKENYPAPV